MKAVRTSTKYEGISKLSWPNGKVTYRATAPWWVDAEGKRHDPTAHRDTLAAARTWRTEQLALRARNVKRPTGRLTVGDYLEDWASTFKVRSPGNTASWYGFGVEKLRAFPIWKMRLSAIEPHDVRRAYDALPAEAIQHVHKSLHRAFADAVPRLLGSNPAAGATRDRKHARAERVVWTEDEYRKFLAAAVDDELYPLWLTLGQTGARRSEALGLEWPDIDLDAGQLTIARQYAPLQGRLTLKEVKTERARRTIEIDEGLVGVLKEWRKRQPARRLGRDAHAVFTYRDGTRVGPSSALNDRLDDVIERAKVRRITIHDLRHVHATLSLRRGTPLHVISRRLGHASESITLNVYAHVLPDQGRLAADAAAAIAGELPVWSSSL